MSPAESHRKRRLFRTQSSLGLKIPGAGQGGGETVQKGLFSLQVIFFTSNQAEKPMVVNNVTSIPT